WDMNGTLLDVLEVERYINRVMVLPDGRIIFAMDSNIYIYDGQFNQLGVFREHASSINSLQLLTDGWILSQSTGRVRDEKISTFIWDVNGNILAGLVTPSTQGATTLLQLADGRFVVADNEGYDLHIWDINTLIDGDFEMLSKSTPSPFGSPLPQSLTCLYYLSDAKCLD
ncbi:MAG TPA: hypothetical protein PLZ51_12355, partial [Aggregatilineales bacterium]|nr:hypothetical protein [Aggregatilineales bacterium]